MTPSATSSVTSSVTSSDSDSTRSPLSTRFPRFSAGMALGTVFSPRRGFVAVAQSRPTPAGVFFGFAWWIGMIPPVCAWFGMTTFGWRLGAGEPVSFSPGEAGAICGAYYLMLLAGFFVAARVALWMRPVYAEESEPGQCFALVAVVGTPMAMGGALHLYPSAALNVAALAPAFLWSVYLLYSGLPVVLKNGPERGMLMASAILGFVLTALAAFLTVVMLLWVNGFGPALGI